MKNSVNKSDVIFEKPGMLGHKLYTYDNVELVHLALEPGKKMAPHTMPVKVIFFILEGKIDVVINNEVHPLSQNEFIAAPVGAERFTANNSDKPARILVIKHPE